MEVLRRQAYTALIGTLGGGCIGLVGWGGAQIIIPGMTHPYAGNLSQLSASGISLVSLSTSMLSSGYQFVKEESVCVTTAAAIALPSMISARIGTKLAAKLSSDALSLVFHSLSAILIPTHCAVQHYASTKHSTTTNEDNINIDSTITNNDTKPQPKNAPTASPTIPILLQHGTFGLFSGALSALMGVGGLPLTISYLTLFSISSPQQHLPHHIIQGTTICAVAPGTITSALSRLNAIPMQSAAIVTLSAMVGGSGGAKLALWLDDEALRYLYMCSLVVLGGQSVVRSVGVMRRLWRKH